MTKITLIGLGALLLVAVTSAQSTTERNVCTGRPIGSFVRDVRRCDGYFFCHPHGHAMGDICPSPYMFHEAGQKCDFADNVECFACPANQFRVNLPVEGACDQFIQCRDGRATHEFCPSDLKFDREIGQCNLGVTCPTTETRRCPARPDPNNPVYFRDDNDCGRYWACEGTALVEYRCPPNLHFNLEIQQCDRPENAGCNGNGGGGGGEFNCATAPQLTPPIHAHPTDCRRYFICADNVAHPHTCPGTTSFDPSVQNCIVNGVCAAGAKL